MPSQNAVSCHSLFSPLPNEIKELIFFYALPEHALTSKADLRAATVLSWRRLLHSWSRKRSATETETRQSRRQSILESWRIPQEAADDRVQGRHLPEFDMTCLLSLVCRDGRAILQRPLKWHYEILKAQKLAFEATYYNGRLPEEFTWVLQDDIDVVIVFEWLNSRIKFVERLLRPEKYGANRARFTTTERR